MSIEIERGFSFEDVSGSTVKQTVTVVLPPPLSITYGFEEQEIVASKPFLSSALVHRLTGRVITANGARELLKTL